MDLYWYRAKVIEVYDGDTVTADIDCGFGVWLRLQKIRLFGINAPELRGSTLDQGRHSRDYLRALILDKEVLLHTFKDKTGKYGRWLADIYFEGHDESVNQRMIADGKAVAYEP